jgi:hypothetical protein
MAGSCHCRDFWYRVSFRLLSDSLREVKWFQEIDGRKDLVSVADATRPTSHTTEVRNDQLVGTEYLDAYSVTPPPSPFPSYTYVCCSIRISQWVLGLKAINVNYY